MDEWFTLRTERVLTPQYCDAMADVRRLIDAHVSQDDREEVHKALDKVAGLLLDEVPATRTVE